MKFVVLLLVFLKSCVYCLQGCNQTIEAIQGGSKLVRSPYINYDSLGKSLVCWYNIRIKPSLLELNINVDFESFNVGKLVGDHCLGGHMQVLDSKYEAVNDELGFHCGEIKQPKKIVRQTNAMLLVFTAQNISEILEWKFSVSALSKEDLPERYGTHPQFFPGKVGAIVDATYCETVFQDCREQNCYVQSPGFPGVYPRGVSCRYYLSTKAPLIRMYTEGLYWKSFNVDTRRCEGYLNCDYRQLSDECPYDYVSVYDGLDEYSPLIAKFCGTGFFPRSIIGTSNRMFVEFISSRHGPLQNTGFDFKITSSPSSENIYNRTCQQVIQSTQLNGKGEGTLLSIEHWYKPGTNCTYLLQGSATQVVRLYFMKMKINTKDYIKESNETCDEYLVIYDSSWPDQNKIIKAFCNSLALTEQKVDYVSTGSHMLVNFISNTGSYAGSSIYYWAIFDFHETESEGEKVPGSICDEVFTRKVGRMNSPRNTLIYSNPNKNVECKFTIEADSLRFRRISLLLEFTNFVEIDKDCNNCMSKTHDYLTIQDQSSSPGLCHSSCVNLKSVQEFISAGPRLEVILSINKERSKQNYFNRKAPIFQAMYSFLHPAVCGPVNIVANNSGFLKFPDNRNIKLEAEDVYCIWDLITKPGAIIQFTVGDKTFYEDDCMKHSITLSSSVNESEVFFQDCGKSREKDSLFHVPGNKNNGVIKLKVKMKNLNVGRFNLSWVYAR